MPSETQHSYIIELRVKTAAQLFNSFDPSPFSERDLDKKAEDFITDWAREAPPGTPIEIHVHFTEPPEAGDTPEDIPKGIKNYFGYLAERNRHRFRALMGQGRLSLIIGLIFLSFCLWAARTLAGLGESEMLKIAAEGLIIAGWVAMWRPMQIFLYDWWPLRREWQVYSRLAKSRIRVSQPKKKD